MTTPGAGVFTMLAAAARRRNSFTAASSRSHRSSVRLLILSVLSLMPVSRAASDEVDCRAAVGSGYVFGDTVPDTCTVQLTLNDTETEIIDSLKDQFHDFPFKCRLRK